MGDALGRYFPGLVPGRNVNVGEGEGPPQTPKSAPVPVVQVPAVSSGPAWERSTVGLFPVASAVALDEFTCMLRLGPPHILIKGVPFIAKEPERVGWVTRIGTGAITLTIAAIAVAFMVVTVEPKRRRRVVFTSREIMTLMRLVGSLAERATPGAEVGNETVTVSLAEPPNPLFLA